MKNRIWELDALRGLCILGMVAVHGIYDAVELYELLNWRYPPIFTIVKDWGGVAFLLLSGVCATLGSRSVRRGLVVFGCGMAVTAVTAVGFFLGLSHGSLVISFGVLHCLGLSMVLWPVFQNWKGKNLALLGAVLALLGLWLREMAVNTPWLIPFGLTPPGFFTADYFPMLPNFGFFLLGAALGKRLYADKTTRFPRKQGPVSRFLAACGRHSLTIYLLHQPVLLAVLALLSQCYLGGNSL